jgi:soluble lytic murein transglycosylase-like protein
MFLKKLLKILKKPVVLAAGAAVVVLRGRRKKSLKKMPFVKKASTRETVLQWLPMVRAAVARHPGATVPLVLGVMQLESGGDSTATNYTTNHKTGQKEPYAQGLMQLIPKTQRGLGVTNPLDPYQSIEGGTKLLADMMNRYHGDVTYALAAYNKGPRYIDDQYKVGGPVVYQVFSKKKGKMVTVDARPYVAIVLANMAAYAGVK